MVMQTAVIVLSQEAILICSIPPLLPHPPDFSDHNPTRITPFFTIPFKFPNDIVLRSELMRWKTFSSWYLESTPFYFNIFCQNFYMYSRFHIMLKPDLSSISLRVVKTSELCSCDILFTRFARIPLTPSSFTMITIIRVNISVEYTRV